MTNRDAAKSPDASSIVFLGDAGVGKTSLAAQLSGGFFEGNTVATHGINLSQLVSDRGTSRLLDLGGYEPQNGILEKLRDEHSVVALVVVDPLSDSVDYQVKKWLDVLREVEVNQDTAQGDSLKGGNKGPEVLAKILVATRMDRGGPKEGAIQGLQEDRRFDGFFQTSAKAATGIQELRSSILDIVATAPEESDDNQETEAARIVRTMAEALCKLIAQRPSALQEIEWRELERVITTALSAIGFSVELTPPAKDGGKDAVANCRLNGKDMVFYIEVKHWRGGDRPSVRHVSDFVEVNVRDGTEGGLFLSSSGYTDKLHQGLSEILRQNVRLGGRQKIVTLCQHYARIERGTWYPLKPLPDLLFEQTLDGK